METHRDDIFVSMNSQPSTIITSEKVLCYFTTFLAKEQLEHKTIKVYLVCVFYSLQDDVSWKKKDEIGLDSQVC